MDVNTFPGYFPDDDELSMSYSYEDGSDHSQALVPYAYTPPISTSSNFVITNGDTSLDNSLWLPEASNTGPVPTQSSTPSSWSNFVKCMVAGALLTRVAPSVYDSLKTVANAGRIGGTEALARWLNPHHVSKRDLSQDVVGLASSLVGAFGNHIAKEGISGLKDSSFQGNQGSYMYNPPSSHLFLPSPTPPPPTPIRAF